MITSKANHFLPQKEMSVKTTSIESINKIFTGNDLKPSYINK